MMAPLGAMADTIPGTLPDHAYAYTQKAPSKAVDQSGSEVPTVGWPHEQSDLDPDPRAIFGALENGFRYVLLPNAKPQDRTRLHLVVKTGSLQESENERGVAHFLEHMLFNGSTHFPPGELIKYFQKIGMQFGPDVNARTGFLDTVYDINLPTSDRQSLQEALLVMQDYAQGALLLSSEIERERGVILAEKRTRDSADYRAYVASLKFELADTRFPERLPIGTEEVIRSADRSVFKTFYDTWYRPDNMVLVMVGDFDPQIVQGLVEERFAKMAARAPSKAQPDIGKVVHKGVKAFYHHESELGSTSVTVQVLDQHRQQPDNAAYQQQRIEEQLANQIIYNRLMRKINTAGAPITDAGVGSGTFLREIRYGYISADCQPDDWQEALTLIDEELRQALQYGFLEDELERVKKDYRAGLEQAAAQAQTRDSAILARQLVSTVTYERVFRSPEQTKAFAEPILENVTGKDLQDRLLTVWGDNHRLVMVTGNAVIDPSSGTPEETIAATFDRAQAVAVTPPQKSERLVFPYLEPPKQDGRIVKRQDYADIGVSSIQFENDIRLNIKSTDFTDDEILFALSFGEGRAGVPTDKSALAELTDDVLNESGLGQLDKQGLAEALAGKKTEIRFRVRDDRFTLEGRSAPDELELVFQLLYATIRDAAFREDAWQLAYNRYRQSYLTMRQSVDSVLNLYGWRFLSGGDRRFGQPDLEALEGLSAVDVRAWVKPALQSAAMELSIVGDVDPAAVVRLAARYLGGLPGKRMDVPRVSARQGPVFPEGRQMDIAVASQIDKALLIMAFPTADVWEIGRTRRLNVLAEIVSERLRLRIREKLGAAYSPGAFSWPSRTYPNYGLFIIYIPLAPEAMDLVQSEVKAIVEDLRQSGIPEEALQQALGPILTDIKDRLRENRYWLGTVLEGASRHPVQLEWARTITSDYEGITKGDIEELVRRYLDPSKRAVIAARSEGSS
ncbi:MAG: insulinase family protein [Desulfobacterales bacterium]